MPGISRGIRGRGTGFANPVGSRAWRDFAADCQVQRLPWVDWRPMRGAGRVMLDVTLRGLVRSAKRGELTCLLWRSAISSTTKFG